MNETYLLIGAVTVIVIVVMALLGRKSSAKDSFTGNVDSSGQTAAPPPGNPSNIVASNVEAVVRELLDSGRKIEAIKRVREKTGKGLKGAKDLVETMERGHTVSIHSNAPAPIFFGDIDGEARRFVAAGKLIEAVKLVREQKKLSLKDARDYVLRL